MRHRRHYLPLGLAWAVAGCTLTDDAYEPIPAVGASPESIPVVSGLQPMPGAGPEAESAANASPTGASADEGVGLTGALDPGRSNDEFGDPNVATDVAVAALGDAGVDVPGGATGDAGAPLAPSAPCPGTAFDGSCYEFFDELVAWDTAEQRCVAWGGYLATVESSEENGFIAGWPSALGVTNAAGSGIWLGGTDATTDGDFLWRNDGPLSFENWGPNQPDNGAGVDCIEQRNDGSASWYDRRCTDVQRYVCEKPL